MPMYWLRINQEVRWTASCLLMGMGILSLGKKWLGHEDKNPRLPNANAVNAWSYTSSLYRCVTCFVQHRGQLDLNL